MQGVRSLKAARAPWVDSSDRPKIEQTGNFRQKAADAIKGSATISARPDDGAAPTERTVALAQLPRL
jgi:hypothetical protein